MLGHYTTPPGFLMVANGLACVNVRLLPAPLAGQGDTAAHEHLLWREKPPHARRIGTRQRALADHAVPFARPGCRTGTPCPQARSRSRPRAGQRGGSLPLAAAA